MATNYNPNIGSSKLIEWARAHHANPPLQTPMLDLKNVPSYTNTLATNGTYLVPTPKNTGKLKLSDLASKLKWGKGKGVSIDQSTPAVYSLNGNVAQSAKSKSLNLGKAAPWIQGGIETVRALGGISDYTDAQSQYDELLSDVLREYGSNPLANQFLTSSQRSDLRALEKGYTNEGKADIGDFFKGAGSGLVEAVPAALLGLATGGVPGALVGGIGSLVNSGISGMNSAVSQDTANLESLYQALVDANAQYNSMKRIPMQGLGLQQKYVNMYQ